MNWFPVKVSGNFKYEPKKCDRDFSTAGPVDTDSCIEMLRWGLMQTSGHTELNPCFL